MWSDIYRFLSMFLLVLGTVSNVYAASENQKEMNQKETNAEKSKTDQEEPRRKGYTIHFEQDSFTFIDGKNEDRDYTQGTSVEWFGTRFPKTALFNQPLDFFDRQIDKVFGLDIPEAAKISDSITIGLKAYTPEEIGLPGPIENDRPYASFVFITDSKTREFSGSTPNNRSYWRTAFTLGTLGNSISKDFQTMVHQINESGDHRIPRGWDNQIDEPLVFNYQFTRLDNKLVVNSEWNSNNNSRDWGADFGTFWGGNVGTIFVDAFAGVSARYGIFENEYVSLPGVDQTKTIEFAPAPTEFQLLKDGNPDKKCKFGGKWYIYECYFFGTLSLKAVHSNRLLEGYSGDPVRIPSEDLEPVVGLASLGFTLRFTKHSTLSIAQFVRTSEFESDREDSDRNHYYGGIYFAVDNPIK